MSAHTPGPWQTMEVGDDIVRLAVADESGLSVLTVVTEGDAQFAAVYSEADAILIAVAPDLLDELRECRDLLMCVETCSRNNFETLAAERIAAINAIVAKATEGQA